jgi:cob(I)alamin adenosyltransferase
VLKIYTKKGDDGTTGLLYGGRVPKDGLRPEAYGTVDELQSSIGLARAECEPGGELDTLLIGLERDLWVLMSEVATDPSNHAKLSDGVSRVTAEMVDALERHIDGVSARFEMPTEFVVPGQSRSAALLDVARTVCRRAERRVIAVGDPPAQVVPYLNRLSDLLWTLARWQEGDSLPSKQAGGNR